MPHIIVVCWIRFKKAMYDFFSCKMNELLSRFCFVLLLVRCASGLAAGVSCDFFVRDSPKILKSKVV